MKNFLTSPSSKKLLIRAEAEAELLKSSLEDKDRRIVELLATNCLYEDEAMKVMQEKDDMGYIFMKEGKKYKEQMQTLAMFISELEDSFGEDERYIFLSNKYYIGGVENLLVH